MSIAVAVAGCIHGQLDQVYTSLTQIQLERTRNGLPRAELLIVSGDFQALRNGDDMSCMAVPQKYAFLGDFHQYYSGKKKAPILTVFIGGNHEASNYSWELYYGGWVAPNIYFLGFSGVIRYGGLRIASLSGIYHPSHHTWNYVERVPFDSSSLRSIFHMRMFEVKKLMALRFGKIDVMITHDWPLGITDYGNRDALLAVKPYFEEDIREKKLGNPLTWPLLKYLKPRYWFSAHLHCKFAALVPHDNSSSSGHTVNNDIHGTEQDNRNEPTFTRFLALDKPIPMRDFLQVVDIPIPNSPQTPESTPSDTSVLEGVQETRELTQPPQKYVLEYDLEWLAIARLTHQQLPYTPVDLDTLGVTASGIAETMSWLNQNRTREQWKVPLWSDVFQSDVPSGAVWSHNRSERFLSCANPQTERFLALIGVTSNPFHFGSPHNPVSSTHRAVKRASRPSPGIQQTLQTASVAVSLLDERVQQLLEKASSGSGNASLSCDTNTTVSLVKEAKDWEPQGGCCDDVDDDEDLPVFQCSCAKAVCTCGG